ncbi:MAG: RND family efflux transporter MFP subunit [Verrucomicrobiales bacterium]|jgi:RND family efflux transporter MFP subunit
MKIWHQILICIGIVLVVGGVGTILVLSAPEPVKVDAEDAKPTIDILEAQPQSVELKLTTQGLIAPEKQSLIAAEVPGRVTSVSKKYRAGGEFKEGEFILQIDDSDFKAAAAEAGARLADAELAEILEKAQADRALRDWQELGLEGDPGDLVLRVPQLKSAAARVLAAEAAVKKAEHDVKRTKIVAPYPARIRKIYTEVGSYLGAAAPVAEVYAASPYELILPLSLSDYAFVASSSEDRKPMVWLETNVGTKTLKWTGEVVRQTGEIDRDSRSVSIVAQVASNDRDWLQPGLFVSAKVEGQTLEGIFRVPLSAFYEPDKLVIVDRKNLLRFRTVKVIRREGDDALVNLGLKAGDRICMTAMEAVIEGMEVNVQEPAVEEPKTESQSPVLE